MGKGLEFFQKQMDYIGKGDIDGLLRDHYHDDTEMVTFEFVLKGKEALRKYLTVDSPAKSGKVLGFEVIEFAESDDVILFTAVVKSEKLGTFKARDSLYLRDGKVYRHIALTLPPEKDRNESEIAAQATRAIIEKYFDCINRQDWEGWVALFDEKIVIEDSLAPRVEGLPGVRKSVTGIQEGFLRFENRLEEVVAEGNKGMALCRIHAVLKNGATIESPGVNRYVVEDGKIVYVGSIHDSAHWEAATGEAPNSEEP